MVLNAWLSDRSGRSYRHMMVPCLIETVCLLAVAFLVNPWIAVPALALMYFAHNAIQAPLLAVPTTFLTGKTAAAGLATINMIGILGGLVFPLIMGRLRDLTGSYHLGLGVLSGTMLLSAGVVYALRAISRRSAQKELAASSL
jgi:ACS family tartrate transporter-like MFS transporter